MESHNDNGSKGLPSLFCALLQLVYLFSRAPLRASPSPLRGCRSVRAAAAIRPHYTPSPPLVWGWQVAELKASAILAVTGVVSECRGSSKKINKEIKKHRGADGGRESLGGVTAWWRHRCCTSLWMKRKKKERMPSFIPHWTNLHGTTAYTVQGEELKGVQRVK